MRGLAHPDVRAECLRVLTDLPAPLLHQLAAPLLAGTDEAAPLGLIDLVLARSDLELLVPDLRRWMRETELLDAYQYFATAAAASRREEAVRLLREERPAAADPRKFAIVDAARELI